MNEERKALTDMFKKYAKMIEAKLFSDSISKTSKSAKESAQYRAAGNVLYKKREHKPEEHEQIFMNYCNSITLAPLDSKELTLGYGNRSAILFHIKKYDECIKDIDRALSGSVLIPLKIKLLCRKSNSLVELNLLSECQSLLQEAKNLLQNINKEKSHKEYKALISKAEANFAEAKQKSPDKIMKSNDTVVLDESTDFYNCVTIKHSEKYGRQLVALRDYNPGDIIFVEKMYVTIPYLSYEYKYCYHCLAYNWAGIPCENCHTALFCSEECRTEAMAAYHDFECSVVPELINNGLTDHIYHFSIRLLIMGLREAGSIEKLKSILQPVDEKSDAVTLGLHQNEKYILDFPSVYDLPTASKYTATDELAYSAIQCLMAIAKKSNIFDDSIFDGFVNFSENEDVLFIGTLIVKLLEIAEVNSRYVLDLRTQCEHTNKCADAECCKRGSCISLLAGLLNHDCFPNTSRCFTEDKKLVIFALHPIKKDDALFESFSGPFYTQLKPCRLKALEYCHLTCDCRACVENWPSYLLLDRQTVFDNIPIKNTNERKLYADNNNILYNYSNKSFKYNEREVSNLSSSIKKAFEICTLPSQTISLFIHIMKWIILARYGMKEQKPFKEPCTDI